jgi:hypothetical protein
MTSRTTAAAVRLGLFQLVLGGGCGNGAGGARTSPLCPASPPTQGAACPTKSVACQYGSDPRGRGCRTFAQCGPANTWNVSVPTVGYPSYCLPLNDPGPCPASVTAAQGQACPTDLSFCDVGGAPCACTACSWNGGGLGQSCGTPLTWRCQTRPAQNSPDCPVLDPNPGASCASEGLSCTYYCGGAGKYLCQDGVWVAGLAGPCPV